MAKETKKNATVSVADVNEENFEQHVNNIGRFTEEEIAMADEKDAQEIKERKAREFNSVKYKASYQKMRIVADCVYSKKAMEAQKKAMKKVLADIQDGSFAKEFLLDMSSAGGQVHFKAMRKLHAEHPSEKVGKEIRKLYSWNNEEDKLVNN